MASYPTINAEPIDTSRYECLNGRLMERPSPTIAHAQLQTKVLDLLRERGKTAGLEALLEVSLEESQASRNEWLTPDVLVASGPWFEAKANGHALPPVLLAVEVLSPGQSFFNMRPKVDTLLRWGVAHVWLVDPESSTAMVFHGDGPDIGHVIFAGALEAGELNVQLNEVFFATDPRESPRI